MKLGVLDLSTLKATQQIPYDGSHVELERRSTKFQLRPLDFRLQRTIQNTEIGEFVVTIGVTSALLRLIWTIYL